MPRRNDPLRARGYLHFDERPSRADLEGLVSNPQKVAAWQFLPLLAVTVKTKKVKVADKACGTFTVKQKDRLICYASHRDAALYAHYAGILSSRYEEILRAEDLAGAITAFRPSSGRCNIHFALDAFQWIARHRPCVALAFDIKGFFDSLDHAVLKRKWSEVLGQRGLPSDHFAVFRSLAKFAVAKRDKVYGVFGISANNPRASGRNRVCSAREFREKVVAAGLVEVNPNTYGIPQGTPISAVLSNIYLLDFDRAIASRISSWGGLYRRYCDDILCVVPPEHCSDAMAAVEDEIKKVKLEIQSEKTGRFAFIHTLSAISPPLQYLGLTFDGVRTLLRAGGIGRYHSRMRSGVRAAAQARNAAARNSGKPVTSLPIKLGKLMTLYGYTGKRNFITYALRASQITGDDGIKRQVSRHWSALKLAVRSRT